MPWLYFFFCCFRLGFSCFCSFFLLLCVYVFSLCVCGWVCVCVCECVCVPACVWHSSMFPKFAFIYFLFLFIFFLFFCFCQRMRLISPSPVTAMFPWFSSYPRFFLFCFPSHFVFSIIRWGKRMEEFFFHFFFIIFFCFVFMLSSSVARSATPTLQTWRSLPIKQYES